jgi:tRNA threonylcarbamoyladenosine biosynthesis protein TsaE
MQRFLPDLEALTKEAKTFAGTLAPKTRGATLITLSGELGAGKTSFVQGVAASLGVVGSVTSPTFVLEKVYELRGQPFSKLIHIDAYRLVSGDELRALGFDELMGEAGNLVLLEWPEKVSDLLPAPAHRITLTVPETGGRSITYA